MKRFFNAIGWLLGILLIVQVVWSFFPDPEPSWNDFAFTPIPLDECGQAYLDKDYGLAATACTPLADQGAGHALYILSELHKEGLGGLRKDSPRQFALLEQAAEAKNTMAMVGYAIVLQAGEQVEKDIDRAFSIMNEAAELGDPFAQFWLATLFYSLGQGTERNKVVAQKWFILAAESPTLLADKEMFQSVRLKQESELTPQQLAEADRLADEWRKQNLSISNRIMLWILDAS